MSKNTFGDEIKDFADEAAELKTKASVEVVVPIKKADNTLQNNNKKKINNVTIKSYPKSPKSKKVKFGTLAKYILTELSLLDDEFEEVNFEIAAQESLENGKEDVIESLETRLISIEGSVDVLYQMGRHFGLASEAMIAYIPNINYDYMDRHKGVEQTVNTAMKV